jgi:hypothetical protein
MERKVFAAEDIAFPDPSTLEGEEMALRYVVDVNHVKSGVDIGGHAPGGSLEHHASGRCRLEVADGDTAFNPVEVASRAARPHQDFDAMPCRDETSSDG